MVDHDIDDRLLCHPQAAYYLCSYVPWEVGESASLGKLIEDLQNVLVHATTGMAALAAGLWSGVVMPLHQMLHTPSAPYPGRSFNAMHKRWHLDTPPRISQVVEVAVYAWIIGI